MTINRLFVANRGEIALRILRTAKRLGLETVLAVSDADRDSQPAKLADRAVVLGPAQASKSYLDVNLVLHAAKATVRAGSTATTAGAANPAISIVEDVLVVVAVVLAFVLPLLALLLTVLLLGRLVRAARAVWRRRVAPPDPPTYVGGR